MGCCCVGWQRGREGRGLSLHGELAEGNREARADVGSKHGALRCWEQAKSSMMLGANTGDSAMLREVARRL